MDLKKKLDNSTIVPRVEQIEQLLVRNVGSVMQPLHQLLEPTPDEVSKIDQIIAIRKVLIILYTGLFIEI